MTLDIWAISESSDYEDPRDDYRDEWMEWCDFNGPDRYYGFSPEDGRPSFLSLNVRLWWLRRK